MVLKKQNKTTFADFAESAFRTQKQKIFVRKTYEKNH